MLAVLANLFGVLTASAAVAIAHWESLVYLTWTEARVFGQNTLGLVLMGAGRLEEAIAVLQTAVRLAPRDPQVRSNLAPPTTVPAAPIEPAPRLRFCAGSTGRRRMRSRPSSSRQLLTIRYHCDIIMISSYCHRHEPWLKS